MVALHGLLLNCAAFWGSSDVGRTPTPCTAYLVRFAFIVEVEGHQMKTPEPSKENPSAPDTRKFTGTDNPRHLRVIPALMTRPRRREDIDDIAGCSNGPDLIAALRAMGLEVPCNRVKFLDRDGNTCRPGIYSFTERDRRQVWAWLARVRKGSNG